MRGGGFLLAKATGDKLLDPGSGSGGGRVLWLQPLQPSGCPPWYFKAGGRWHQARGGAGRCCWLLSSNVAPRYHALTPATRSDASQHGVSYPSISTHDLGSNPN